MSNRKAAEMTLSVGSLVLGERYKLVSPLTPSSREGQLWSGDDQEEWVKPYLLKIWPFQDSKPDDVQRALWDAELRTLYRVRSTPGSEESLLQLKNMGIDHEHRCFVMVFETTGLATLAALLEKERQNHYWLSGRDSSRKELWQMLMRIANGLALLHDQQVVHRSVAPEVVFLDPGEGPDSCRLGGFEWSVRLGRPAFASTLPVGWETAPEAIKGSAAFGPDADWFAFGMMAARCMLSIEHLNRNSPEPMTRYRHVLDQLAKSKRKLMQLEIDFIEQLIAEEPSVRPKHNSEIQTRIKEILRALREPQVASDAASRHIVMIDPHRRSLIDSSMERGLRAVLQLEPGMAFDPQRPEHVSCLHTFLYQDFADGATISPIPHRDQYLLSGKTMHLKISAAVSIDNSRSSWQNAFCQGASSHMSTAVSSQVTVPAGRIEFFSTKERKSAGYRLAASASWESILPAVDRVRERRQDQERFSEFIRMTNQIDILIRDAELFRCEVVDLDMADGICSLVTVRELPREHEPLAMFKMDGGMAEFLFREKSSGKPGSNRIQLCSPVSESIAHRSEEPEWIVETVDIPNRSATLRPMEAVPRAPKIGDAKVLRTTGLGGQVLLIKRRKEAIDKLSKHTYLLESLSAPGQVLMDSGPATLPIPLSTDTVDPSKLAQIKKILGVRPIYALQGPPGTGKTHMVAWLLREILEEDPVAQILITAQAHPAVDVLRAKVEQEAFQGVPLDRKPLAIRLRRTASVARSTGLTPVEPGSELEVTREILERAIKSIEHIATLQTLPPVQEEWLVACRTMLADLVTSETSLAKEFRELVKRSANITYSTAGDGDLAALAGEVSYDWAIVEEAGKAHGFELALPLFLGHRWLLIGDPKQLPPYRIEDYEKAVGDLDATVAALEELDGAGNLLDRELLQGWRERNSEQRQEFIAYCKAWLRLFAQLHKLCAYHEHEDGLLTGQHRMHPHIGELVSDVYYGGKLEHYTRDPETGGPMTQIMHGLTAPSEVVGKAIVWLDLPSADDDPRAGERSVPKYRNPAEALALRQFLGAVSTSSPEQLSIAVLSPYAQQVGYLRQQMDTPEFRRVLASAGLRLALDPRGGGHEADAERRDGFFTVDSFQGNQAAIIAVSLVRNNTRVPGDGLGFLVEEPRLNVLISRAERLLVLVGSWDFFRTQVRHVSRIRREYSKLQHIALVVDRLEQWFSDGTAVRIAANRSILNNLPREFQE